MVAFTPKGIKALHGHGKTSPLNVLDDVAHLGSRNRAASHPPKEKAALKETVPPKQHAPVAATGDSAPPKPPVAPAGGEHPEFHDTSAYHGGNFTGEISPKHPEAKPAFAEKESAGGMTDSTIDSIVEEHAKSLGSGPHPGVSRKEPSAATASNPITDASATVDPALLIGGVATAGLGAAAIASGKKQTSLLGTIEDGALNVTDKVTGALDTTANYVNLAILPVMLGGMATSIIGSPIAGVADWMGWKAPTKGLAKVNGVLEKAQTYTVADAGKHLDHFVSHEVSGSIGKGVQKVADAASHVTHPLSHIPGFKELSKENIRALPGETAKSSLAHTAMNAAWITTSAVSLYHTARDFGGQTIALRQLIADLEGKNVEQVSSYRALLGDAPAAVASARRLLLETAGVHTLVEVATLGMIVKTAAMNRIEGMMGMLAWTAPDMLRQVSEGILGQSILPVYKSMSDAQKAGEHISAEAYAEFILLANDQLRNRGNTGQRFANELAKTYEQNQTALHVIVADISSGKMKQDVNDIIARNKALTETGATSEVSFQQREMQRRASHMVPAAALHAADDSWKSKIEKQTSLANMTPASHSIN